MATKSKQAKKAITQKERDRRASVRLQRLYGITLDEYNRMLRKQGGGCAICGAPAISRRLHVDHSHKFRYFKVHVRKIALGWYVARAPRVGIRCNAFGRNAAIQLVRHKLKRLSVRGIICFSCNGGLRKFRDNHRFLEAAALYIEDHENRCKRGIV